MGKLKLFIIIIACVLITVVSIIQNTTLFKLSVNLIITIAVFYVIGGILENYLKKKVFSYDNIDGEETLTNEDDNEGQNLK